MYTGAYLLLNLWESGDKSVCQLVNNGQESIESPFQNISEIIHAVSTLCKE